MSQEEKKSYKEEKQEREWSDPNEHAKFVCQGGQIQCKYCNVPISEIIVTSTTVMLQDKPWATIKDSDGLVNFNFTGQCMHSSQQKPFCPPPPCKAVINLGEWQNFSETIVDTHHALVVKSTIPCMISGEDLEIVDSGQKATLEKIEPKQEKSNQKIQSIELLEGETVKTGTVIQYVNITPYAKYVDSEDITHIDRLGKNLRLRVRFDKAGSFKFKVKLIPDSKNASYTTNEKKRNPNFKYSEEEEFVTDSNGEKVIDGNKIFTSAAGGDIFTIIAKDEDGNQVIAEAKIKTERRIYYVEAKMTGLTTVTTSLKNVEKEYHKHGISLKGFPAVEMPFMENISIAQQKTFIRHVMSAYVRSACKDKMPYGFVIGYTGHLAEKSAKTEFRINNIRVGVTAKTVIIPTIYPLWIDVAANEDWFVESYFIRDGGEDADKIAIVKEKCTPIQNPDNAVGWFDSVSIDVSSLPAGQGSIILVVYYVEKMLGGVSGGGNFIGICTKAYWTDMPHDEQQKVIIHELGHSLKMVTDGDGILPQKTPYHYSGKGHQGNHCHCGLPIKADYSVDRNDVNLATCVMFGIVNNASSYCKECAKAVRKLDMSAGFN